MLTEKKERFLWISLFFIFMILFMSFNYSDLIITTGHGINFWDILTNGRIVHFYEDNSSAPYVSISTGNCVYSFLYYIVFALWNFPLWLLGKASVDVMNNLPCLMWAKLLPVLAVWTTMKLIQRIMKTMGVSQKQIKLAVYLYLSSSMILTSVLINSRYDSICSVFMLLALQAFQKRNEKKFLLWSGISFCFNYLTVLVFLPLLVLREKKILKIIWKTVLMLIPYFLTTIPFIFHPSPERGQTEKQLFSVLFARTNGRFSWFVITYIIILVYAYIQDEEKSAVNLPIWLACFSLASIIAFCFVLPYWPIMLIPYIAMIIGTADESKDQINLILEAMGVGGLVLGDMVYFYWCYGKETMQKMLISVLFPEQLIRSHVIMDIWIRVSQYGYIQLVFNSVFVVGMILLAVINFPNEKINSCMIRIEDKNDLSQIIILRWIFNVLICIIPFITLIR